jgi:hypothetical protein
VEVVDRGVAAPGWPAAGGAVAGGRIVLASRNLDATRVAEVGARSLSLRRERVIAAGAGAWGVGATAGRTVVGLFGARGGANLWDLHADGRPPTALAALAVDYVWDVTVLQDGRVVCVGGAPDVVVVHEPATGQARLLGIVEPGQGVRTCAVVGDRVVVGGAAGGRAVLRVGPLAGGAGRPALPPALADDELVYSSAALPDGRVAVGTVGPGRGAPALAVVAPDDPAGAAVVRLPGETTVDAIAVAADGLRFTTRPSGALHRVAADGTGLRRLAVPVARSETRRVGVDGGATVGVSADGSAWRWSGGMTLVRRPAAMGLALRPQRPQSIVAGDGRVDVGGSFSATRHDVASGAVTTRFVPGEPKCGVAVADVTYTALYPVAQVWAWREGADAPALLARLVPGQVRPVAMAWAPDLDAVVVTSTDDRGGSAVQLVDRVGRVRALPSPVAGQAVAGVAAARAPAAAGALLLGGSGASPWLAAVDPRTGAVRWQRQGVVPDGAVIGIAPLPGRVVVTSSTGWAAAVSPDGRPLGPAVRVAPQAGQLRAAADGLLLATGDALLRLDPVTLAAAPLLTGLAAEPWGWPPMDVDPAGRPWLLRGRRLVTTR